MMKTLRYAIHDLRRGAIPWILHKSHLRSIFSWVHVLLLEVSLPAPLNVKTRLVAYAKLADKEDISRLAKQFKKFQKGEAEKRVKAGNLCFVAYVNGKIAHYRWIAFGPTDIKHVWGKLQIGSNSVYSFDAYTVPEYRGLGLGPFVFKNTLYYLNKKRVSKLYALIDKNNKSSIRAAQKQGYRLVGEIIFRQILKYRYFRYEGQTVEGQQTMERIVSFEA